VSCLAYPQGSKVDFHGWPVGAEVELILTDPDMGPDADYRASTYTAVAPWDLESSVGTLELGDLYELTPGHVITCVGAGRAKEHRVTDLAILAVDAERDIVQGMATPGSEVQVILNPPGISAELAVTAGSDGKWVADFGQLFDIDSDTKVEAIELDNDGDGTSIAWS
jgi:hypothetical protein